MKNDDSGKLVMKQNDVKGLVFDMSNKIDVINLSVEFADSSIGNTRGVEDLTCSLFKSSILESQSMPKFSCVGECGTSATLVLSDNSSLTGKIWDRCNGVYYDMKTDQVEGYAYLVPESMKMESIKQDAGSSIGGRMSEQRSLRVTPNPPKMPNWTDVLRSVGTICISIASFVFTLITSNANNAEKKKAKEESEKEKVLNLLKETFGLAGEEFEETQVIEFINARTTANNIETWGDTKTMDTKEKLILQQFLLYLVIGAQLYDNIKKNYSFHEEVIDSYHFTTEGKEMKTLLRHFYKYYFPTDELKTQYFLNEDATEEKWNAAVNRRRKFVQSEIALFGKKEVKRADVLETAKKFWNLTVNLLRSESLRWKGESVEDGLKFLVG